MPRSIRTRAGRLRQIAVLVVATLLLAGLSARSAPAAQADPGPGRITVVNWDIDGLENSGPTVARTYWNFIAAMHSATGHAFSDQVTETSNREDTLIEVRISRGSQGHTASLYLWADDLYLAGWWTRNDANTVYAFSDHETRLRAALNNFPARRLAATSNYNNLVGGSVGARGPLTLAGRSMDTAFRRIENSPQYFNGNQHILEQAAVVLITIVAEATRYVRILDLMRFNLDTPSTARPLNVGGETSVVNTPMMDRITLEQRWANISEWMATVAGNPEWGVDHPYQWAGHDYNTVQRLALITGGMQMKHR